MTDKNKTVKELITDLAEQGVFDAFRDAISIQDTDYKVLYQNQSHKNMIGEHIGEYCYKAYQRKDDVCETCPLTTSFKDGKVHEIEQARDTDNGIFYYKITSSPLKDPAGKIIAGLEVVTDITKRKKAEKALATSEEKYRLLVNSLQEGIWALDTEENTTFVNDRMAEMLGYTAEEMLGKKVFDFMDERGIKLCKEKMEARKAGVKEQHDFELIRKDGSVMHVLMEASPIQDEDGNYIGGVASVIDITGRKEAEELLRESERQLKDAQRIAKIGSWEWDIATNAVFWSPELYWLTGIDPQGSPPSYDDLHSFYTQESWERLHAAVQQAISLKKTYNLELEVIRRDGTHWWQSAFGEPVTNEKGEVVKLRGTIQDITIRKLAEEAVRESEERLRAIFDNANEGILIADVERKRFNFANKKICTMLGYGIDEVKSLGVADIHPAEYLPEVINKFEKLAQGEIAKAENVPVLRKDGAIFFADVGSALITLAGKKQLAGFFTDITERKKTEAELNRYREYLEQLVKERTDEIEKQKNALEFKNIALREVIGQIELEKNKIKENVLHNIEELVIPGLNKAKAKGLGEKQIGLIEHNLKNITSSFGSVLSSKKLKLTPREIDVCNMVEKGMTNKEMSDFLNISIQSIEGYRKNIRKKLGLANKKVNLISYLRSII